MAFWLNAFKTYNRWLTMEQKRKVRIERSRAEDLGGQAHAISCGAIEEFTVQKPGALKGN